MVDRAVTGGSRVRGALLVAALALLVGAAPAAAAPQDRLRLGGLVLHPLRGGQALVVRHVAAPARPGAARRAADRHRLPLAAAATGRGPAPGAGGRRGRARLSLDRQPRGVHGHLPPAAARARAAAGGQPRHRGVRSDRLPAAAGLRRCHVRPELPEPGGGLRPQGRAPPRVGRPLLHRLRRARHGGGAPRAAARPGRPVRRLLRHLLRPGVHRALPGPAALGAARLLLSGARARPVVRVVRDGGARGAGRGVRARSGLRGRRAGQRGGAARTAARAAAGGADRGAHARGRRQPGAGALRRARDRRHGPGRRVRAADLPRARPGGARRARRRRGAPAAPGRRVARLSPRPGRRRRRLLLGRPLLGGRLHGLPAAVLDGRVARAAARAARRAAAGAARRRIRPVHRARVDDRRQLHPALYGVPRLAATAARAAGGAARTRARCRRRSRS